MWRRWSSMFHLRSSSMCRPLGKRRLRNSCPIPLSHPSSKRAWPPSIHDCYRPAPSLGWRTTMHCGAQRRYFGRKASGCSIMVGPRRGGKQRASSFDHSRSADTKVRKPGSFALRLVWDASGATPIARLGVGHRGPHLAGRRSSPSVATCATPEHLAADKRRLPHSGPATAARLP